MKNYKDLLNELPSKTVVFTCGRFNPPNLGHELSIKVVRKLASQRKADHFIFVSSIQDAKKNPLEIGKKMQYLGSLFPNTKFVHKEIDAIGSVLKKYKSVTLVTPAASVEYYKRALKKHGITNVEIVKAGSTCPDEDDKLIKMATKGEYFQFKSNLPTTVRDLDGKRLMNDIRIGLNIEPIKEQINLVKDDLREQYFRGELFSEGDIVESDNTVYKIIKRGSNHLLLQNESGLKVSKWIQDVQLTEREFMLDEKLIQEADATSATGANKEAKKAQADTSKMKLALDQAKAKEDLVKQQERERDNLKNVAEAKDSPVVDTSKKYNIAKSIMSLSDFRKSTGQMSTDETDMSDKVHDGLIGNTHMTDNHGTRHRKVKYHMGEEVELEEGNGYDDNRTGFAKKPREDDEYHNEPKPKFKAKSTMDRPHTVHIDGKPWKKFDNGHQAHAAAKTLTAKGKKATAIAHFGEETEEQTTTRTSQLKRFKDQAKDSKLTEAQYAGLEKEDKPGKVKTAVVKTHPKAVEIETVEGWKDEKKPVKEEFDDIDEEEFASLVEADLAALSDDSDDFFEAYDDEELAIIDEETGEEIDTVDSIAEEALMEVLSRIERIRAKARMKRSQTKRQRREKVALRQLSTPQVANKRARRMAISAMKKRLLRGQNPQKISVGQKERVERFIAQRKKVVDRLATRMVSRVKQVEKARMSHKKFTKPNNGVQF